MTFSVTVTPPDGGSIQAGETITIVIRSTTTGSFGTLSFTDLRCAISTGDPDALVIAYVGGGIQPGFDGPESSYSSVYLGPGSTNPSITIILDPDPDFAPGTVLDFTLRDVQGYPDSSAGGNAENDPHTVTFTITIAAPPDDSDGAGAGAGAGGDGDVTHVTPEITSHCERGKLRLLAQYQDKPRLAAVLCALLDEVQETEQLFADLRPNFTLDAALGAQLDAIGDLVGEPRNGLGPDAYRRRIRARILVNASAGRADDLIAILVLLVHGRAPVSLTPVPNAQVRLRTWNIGFDDGTWYALMLGAAAAAGVHLVLEHQRRYLPVFGFQDSVDPAGNGTIGWAEDQDSPADGQFASASGA